MRVKEHRQDGRYEIELFDQSGEHSLIAPLIHKGILRRISGGQALSTSPLRPGGDGGPAGRPKSSPLRPNTERPPGRKQIHCSPGSRGPPRDGGGDRQSSKPSSSPPTQVRP